MDPPFPTQALLSPKSLIFKVPDSWSSGQRQPEAWSEVPCDGVDAQISWFYLSDFECI